MFSRNLLHYMRARVQALLSTLLFNSAERSWSSFLAPLRTTLFSAALRDR